MIHFLTFYSQSFTKQEENLRTTLEVLYPQYKYCAINLDDTYSGTDHTEKNKFNYYSFKPELLLKYLQNVPLGDIIIYLDTNDLPQFGLVEYINDTMSQLEIDLIVSTTNYFQKSMRHPKTKEFLSATFYKVCGYMLQPEAGCIALKKTTTTTTKVANWLHYTQLIAQINREHPDKQSRHDQEALTYTLFQTRGNLVENWYCHKLFGTTGLRTYIKFEGNRID
jgi:hypothetical protein